MLWSSTGKSKEDAANLVLQALENKGWRDICVDTISVKDVSGGGGSQTFKVSAEAAQPLAVALHCRNFNLVDKLVEDRSEAVATLLGSSGVAPQRLAQAEDWFIEPWDGEVFAWGSPEHNESIEERPPKCSTEGCNFWASDQQANVSLFGGYYCCLKCAGKNNGKPGEHDEVGFLLPCKQCAYTPYEPIAWAEHPHATWGELGALMAKVHKTPTEWYEDFRTKLCSQLPLIKNIPPESCYWWWGRQVKMASEWSDAGYRQWAEDAPTYTPVTEAARRLVTCHGDFQMGNVLRTSTGELKVIDFENSLVCCAAMDVCWAFAVWCNGSRDEQKRFIKGYLAEAGFPCDAENVDAFFVDIEIFYLTIPGAVASNVIPRKEGPLRKGSPGVRKLCAETVSKYRSDAAFRAEVDAIPDAVGLVPWQLVRGLTVYIETHLDYVSDPSIVEIRQSMEAEAQESTKSFEGKSQS